MFKFFRKIRQRLLTENKFSKYILYAIGEILIIVFGVLIAVQINNWNEQVKKDKTIASVFETIKKNLIQDVKEVDKVIQFYVAKDSLIELVLNRKVTKEQYQDNPKLRTLVMYYNEIAINTMGYESLKENINDVPLEYEKALIDINFIYTRILQSIEINIKSSRSLVEHTLQKWADNYSWYRTPRETTTRAPNDDMIDFFLNDSSYLGDVRMYKMIGILNHLQKARQFKLFAISAIIKIDQVNNISFEQSIDDLNNKIDSIELINMNPIQDYVFKTIPTDYQSSRLIINNSFNEELFFYYKYEEGFDVLVPIEEKSIEPKTIGTFYLLKDIPFIVKDSIGNTVGTFKPTSSYNCINLKYSESYID